MIIEIKKEFPDAEIPAYATEGSAGFDLKIHNFKKNYTNRVSPNDVNELEVIEDFVNVKEVLINPHGRLLIGCGYSVAIPEGFEIQVRPRSGIALKHGITVINSPGTIDSDYRGEVMVTLINTSSFIVKVELGERVAQAVLSRYEKAIFEEKEELVATIRGSGGMGSTGKK